MKLLWWLSGALLLPLLLLQGRRARALTPRLPEAAGETVGTCGSGPPLRLLVIGESPVAGVGVETFEQALAARLARELAPALGRTVRWRALGENGADAAGVLQRLVPRADEPCDLALVVLGVNDTTHFTGIARWQKDIRAIVAALRQHCSGPIVAAGVPPLGQFTALPQPLRAWLGLRARILDAALREALATEQSVAHLPTPALAPQHLARDGYHPSAAGAAAWAELLAQGIVPLLKL